MHFSTQLLSSLLLRREGAVQAGPVVGDKLADSPQGPTSLELGDDVHEVVTHGNAEVSAGQHQGVCPGKALGRGERAREHIVISADARPANCPLGVPVVDLEAAICDADFA